MPTSNILRSASHAGTWYSSSPTVLNAQIDKYLSQAPALVDGARIIVGPHAGYSYAGATLAKSYKAFDSTNIKRVFILGPSHHIYFKNHILTSDCSAYETPFGNVSVDTATIDELVKLDPKMFKKMPLEVDEDEHSFEMHMPFLYKVTKDLNNFVPKIIPIMISSSNEQFEKKLANYLKPYFEDKHNAFIISTDFCHWGARFGYTTYTPDGDISHLLASPVKHSKGLANSLEIFKSIEVLDKTAMSIISNGSYPLFKNYLNETGNTICGAKPLSVLMLIMESYYKADGDKDKFKWLGYTQSSQVISPSDSSVSYASGYAIL